MGSSKDGGSTVPGEGSAPPGEDPSQRGFRGLLRKVIGGGAGPQPGPDDAAQEPGQVVRPGLSALKSLRVDDVALPKVEIVAVPIDIGKDDLVEVFRKSGFSRLPVYKGSLDHPQGLVLLKDLALQHGFGASGRFSLKKLLRPVLYAPPSMPLSALLQKMQRDRVHMALVIDEYGGVDGLVTIEDLIETVIGEIEDEHDEAELKLWRKEKPGVYLAQSTTDLDEFEAEIGMKLRREDEDDEIDTLGGLVFQRTGRVPSRGEIVPHESGVQFQIVEADPRRIKKLRVRLPSAIAAAAQAAEAAKAATPAKGGR